MLKFFYRFHKYSRAKLGSLEDDVQKLQLCVIIEISRIDFLMEYKYTDTVWCHSGLELLLLCLC